VRRFILEDEELQLHLDRLNYPLLALPIKGFKKVELERNTDRKKQNPALLTGHPYHNYQMTYL
jgi:hypothetical protein